MTDDWQQIIDLENDISSALHEFLKERFNGIDPDV